MQRLLKYDGGAAEALGTTGISRADTAIMPLSAAGCGEFISCVLTLWQLDYGLAGEAAAGSLMNGLAALLVRGGQSVARRLCLVRVTLLARSPMCRPNACTSV